VVVPVSDTERYNEFRNTDLALLKALIGLPGMQSRRIVLCGRILDESALRARVPGDYAVVRVSYDEGREIATMVTGSPEPATRPLWDDESDRVFHLSQLLARRNADHPVVLVGQRGCPFACAFCERVLIWPERRVERVEPGDLACAMRHLRDRHGRRHFVILDPVFDLDDTYVEAFCRHVEPLGVRWHAELRPDRVRRRVLHRMRAAGCYRVLLGVETFDEAVARAVNKPMRPDVVRRAIAACRAESIQTWSSFIVGLGRSVREAYRSVSVTAQTVRRENLGWAHGVPYFLYEGTRAYRTRFGDDGYGAFPRWYHPFPLPIMADLTVLFRNLIDGNEEPWKDRMVASFMDIARSGIATPSGALPGEIVASLSGPAGRQELFRSLLCGNPARTRQTLDSLAYAWHSDTPAGRYDLAEEQKRWALDSSAVQPWP